MNSDKFTSALGLSRRAGKLAIGHDDVKHALRGGAQLVVMTADASDRLKAEIASLSEGTPLIQTQLTMNELGSHIGTRAAVVAVTDKGLASLAMKAYEGAAAKEE